MYVNRVDLNKTVNYRQMQDSKKNLPARDYSFQTSLYDTKGVNVHFGSLARGINAIENECIDILRDARIGRSRRFSEYDIEDIIKNLKFVKDQQEKPDIVKSVMALDEEHCGVLPDVDMFKKLVKTIAERPEDERFAILQFAQSEIEKAAKPMETFFNLPYKIQDGLTKLLCKIDDVNESFLFKDDYARMSTIDSLYDTFRVALYGHEDMADIDKIFRGRYKKENLEILKSDYNYYKKQDVFKNDLAKEKVLSVVQSITDYFEKNI